MWTNMGCMSGCKDGQCSNGSHRNNLPGGSSILGLLVATRSGHDDPDGFRHVFRKPEEIGVTSMKLRKNIVSTSKYISTIPRNLSFFHIRLFE